MQTDLAFRLSSYLTLGLACVCLGYAELLFLPGIAAFVLPVLVLLAAAFFAEGHWCLTIRAANALGVVIAAGSALWIIICLVRPVPARLDGVPMPIALLPYLGPLLAVLLVAKLFRPKKASDLWLLQGMGLIQVALGCVLAGGLLFGLLLVAYLASALWFLALFHQQRELACQPAILTPGRSSAGTRPTPGRYPVARWTLAVAAAGLLLFLLVPRFGATQWNFLGQLSGVLPEGWSAQTGVSDTIDLNRTGVVRVNDKVALVVAAEDARGPKLDLDPGQRWRVTVLDAYHEGRWRSAYPFHRHFEPDGGGDMGFRRWRLEGDPEMPFRPWRPDDEPDVRFRRWGPRWWDPWPLSQELPHLGTRRFVLSFTYDPNLVGGLVLAEPVVVSPGSQVAPVAPLPDRRRPEIDFLGASWTLSRKWRYPLDEVSYRQVAVPLEEPDLSPPLRIRHEYATQLGEHRAPALAEWTAQLLRDLAARSAYRLSAVDLEYADTEQGQSLKPVHHEKAARALCNYLATSGEYTYTLELRRHDRQLDPIDDFLRHVKQGHCERYAGALALMLRSQGIPARVVKGFRGCEHLGDGRYAIRHSDAHSWVEVLVRRPQPDGSEELHWLTLDPTPGIEAPTAPRYSAAWLWDHGRRTGLQAWRDFVVEYDTEQQAALWDGPRGLLAGWDGHALGAGAVRLAPWLVLALVMLAAFWLGRRRWVWGSRAGAGRVPGVSFYARLLVILARRCRLHPGPAQTPREFGVAAGQLLQGIPAAAALAEVPARTADLFYRVRYGRQPLSAEEQQDVDRDLEQLDLALGEKAPR